MHRIEFTQTAERQLRALPRDTQRRVGGRIGKLADDPRPSGVKKLVGEEGLYRIRVGDYRIVYEIHDDRLVVLVIRIGHRREVYRSGR